jgi:hypothetical protein
VKTRVIGWSLALLTVITVMISQRSVGIARDEAVYMSAGSHYADWWFGLVTFDHGISSDNITKFWGGPQATDNNREHPPLMKEAFGVSKKLLHDKLHIFGEVTAYRFPSALVHGLFVALIFFFAAGIARSEEHDGVPEGIVAALLGLFLPRAIFHAGLAAFDAPIAALWFATVYAYWRALEKGANGWTILTGVMWGLALATKHTALLLPFALGVHYLFLGVRAARRERRWSLVIAHRWDIIASLAIAGPLTLYILWPWLWFAPVSHVSQWLKFHLTHVHYNFEYLGHNWNAPKFPWHVALVTTLFTVPVATLAAAAIGAGTWLTTYVRTAPENRDARAPALLLVLSAGASIGPFFLGTTPIFGAEKHWMPMLPTLAIAGGIGVVWAARTAAQALTDHARASVIAIAAVAGIVVLAGVVETRAAHPYALTWYNALAGGAPGGADRGMNRQFWGVAARGVLKKLPELGPPGPVYSHDASPVWGIYIRNGLLPAGFADAGMEQYGIDRSKYAIVIHEKHFNRHDYMIWKSYGTTAPVFVLRSDGVPIVSVYKRPDARAK